MSERFALKIKHKPTGQVRFINLDRFNPAIHEKIAGESPMPKAMAIEEMQLMKHDPLYGAVRKGELERQEKLAKGGKKKPGRPPKRQEAMEEEEELESSE